MNRDKFFKLTNLSKDADDEYHHVGNIVNNLDVKRVFDWWPGDPPDVLTEWAKENVRSGQMALLANLLVCAGESGLSLHYRDDEVVNISWKELFEWPGLSDDDYEEYEDQFNEVLEAIKKAKRKRKSSAAST